jgi:hypothetical protein
MFNTVRLPSVSDAGVRTTIRSPQRGFSYTSPGLTLTDDDPRLRARVISDMRKNWSPEQVAGRLRYERSRGETMLSVSHEAIYTWIHALPKGELAGMDIALRSGRERRKPRGRAGSTGVRFHRLRSPTTACATGPCARTHILAVALTGIA